VPALTSGRATRESDEIELVRHLRGVEDQAGWQFTDAWLLTAIGQFGRRGCSLSELIGAADALNHEVAPEPVAADSLGRLIASDLVAHDAKRFRVTKSGRAIYRRRSGGMVELAKSAFAVLPEYPARKGTLTFAPGEYEAAYGEYHRKMSGS
jgi:hypothetical protein